MNLPNAQTWGGPLGAQQKGSSMKYLKVLGVATLAAASLMAWAGVGTASAETTICKTTEDPWSEANRYTVGTKITAKSIAGGEAAKPTLTISGLRNISCKSTLNGQIETTTTPSGKGEATTSECTGGTVTTITNGIITIHHDAEHNAVVTAEGFIRKFVIGGLTCHYGGGVVADTLPVGGPAIIDVTTPVNKVNTVAEPSSAFCPATATTHATYEVTAPKPLYTTKGP